MTPNSDSALPESLMASSVALGLASSLVSSAHPPISSLLVDIVTFSTGIDSSSVANAIEQLKSPWIGSPETVTASLNVHVAAFSIFSSPTFNIILTFILYEAGKLALTKAAKKK